jgi:hypothetical protein
MTTAVDDAAGATAGGFRFAAHNTGLSFGALDFIASERQAHIIEDSRGQLLCPQLQTRSQVWTPSLICQKRRFSPHHVVWRSCARRTLRVVVQLQPVIIILTLCTAATSKVIKE